MPLTKTPAGPPSNLIRVDASSTKTSVALTWTAPTELGNDVIIDYSLHMFNSVNSAFEETASGITGTSFTKTGLTTGEEYKFKVLARNSKGDGALSP